MSFSSIHYPKRAKIRDKTFPCRFQIKVVPLIVIEFERC